MEFHSIANVWPMMEDDALQALADDIRQNGLLNPIWTYQGKVLDGRNRLTACRIAQVEPQFREYKGDEPTAFAVSLNDKRRHMTKSALAAVAAELEPMFAEDAKRRQIEAGKRHGAGQKVVQKIEQPFQSNERKANAEAAASVGVNRQYVAEAKRIKTESPETFERMKAGKISIQDAKRAVARIPTDDWTANERQRQRMVESGVAVVANQQADKNLIAWAEENGLAVRIDRGSKYGNPFVMGHDGDRDAVCEKYAEHYVPHKPSILKDIAGLAGKVLVCHCYPERCHGDTLQELAMEAAEP
jgi:ParB-like chromosome segregation protein Spo0J